MTDDRPDLPAQKLMFFGAISASLSHELKNVLATINEYSGLLDDLSQAAATGRPLKLDRLQSICGKISHQIKRGETLIGRMNRFSHSVDEPRITVDLGELLGRICDLCNRFARLKQVTLERRFSQAPVPITIDPFALQYAVYLAVDLALQSVEAGGTVTVAFDDAHQIRVQSSRQVTARDGMQWLRDVMTHLGGGVELQGEQLVLRFGSAE